MRIANARIHVTEGKLKASGRVIGWERGHEGTWLFATWDRTGTTPFRYHVTSARRWEWDDDQARAALEAENDD